MKRQLITKEKTEFIIDDSKVFKKLKKKFFKKYPKIFIYVDKKVLYKHSKFFEHLKSLNKKIYIKSIVSNENAKHINKYNYYIDFLSKNNCSRNDLIIGVGGGVILDISGFVASTYMRKIDLMLVPTNLIGMADASTAGKTCLNTDSGKNLIGSYYLPLVVYNNINFLSSTNKTSMRQGFSEIFKYGLLSSKNLVNLALKYNTKPSNNLLIKIIEETINHRFKIRTYHPLASNLGHTFGHAIEKMSNFKVLHGDAISIGTVIALKFALQENIINKDVFNDIVLKMKKLKLKTESNVKYDKTQWVELMLKDKKSYDSYIGLILIKDIAKPFRKGKLPYFYVKKEKMIQFFENQ